MLIEQNFILSH